MEWIDASKQLPEEEELHSDESPKYYIVKVEGFGTYRAMFFGGAWHTSHIATINKKVLRWVDVEEER
jgi:hypothetical protein